MSSEELPEKIPFDRYVKDIQASHRMRGEYLAFIYDELKKRYGKQTAKDVLSKAIFEYGKYRARARIRQNPEMKTPKDLRPSPFLAYMHKSTLLEETPERLVNRLRVCPILDAVKSLGKTDEEIREICDIAHTINDGITTIYCDELGIEESWSKKLCHGDPYCEVIYEKVKEK